MVQVKLQGLGVEWSAIMEFHIVTQLEGVGLRIGLDLHGSGQTWVEMVVSWTAPHKIIHHREIQRLLDLQSRLGWVKEAERLLECIDQIAATDRATARRRCGSSKRLLSRRRTYTERYSLSQERFTIDNATA
jgi:hypothetical protein